MKAKILDKKEKKEIERMLAERFGACIDLVGMLLLRTTKNKIYISTKKVQELLKTRARIENVGMYFARITHREELRLTIEGSQIIFPLATKNVVNISKKDAIRWTRGFEIETKPSKKIERGFVLLANEKDCYGCGKYTGERIDNYVKKSRRIKKIDI